MKTVNFKNGASFITMLLLLSALFSVNAQEPPKSKTPHYCESYDVRTEKLTSKNWLSGEHVRGEMYDENGKMTQVMIYRADSAKTYIVDHDKKTCTVFPVSQQNGYSSLAGITTTKTVKTEYIGEEIIEGRKCKHFRAVTSSSMNIGSGAPSTQVHDTWYDAETGIVIKQCQGAFCDFATVARNIKFGPQPAELFELPKGYEIVDLSGTLNQELQKIQNIQDMLKSKMK